LEEISSDLQQLDAACVTRYFPVEGRSPNNLTQMRCSMVTIDTNYRTKFVHAFVRTHQQFNDPIGDRVRCVRGDHNVKSKDHYRMSEVEKSQREGFKYKNGMQLYGIGTGHYKDDISNKMFMKKGIAGGINFPESIVREGEDFLKQMTNVRKVEETDRRTNRKKEVYETISRSIGEHYSDGSVYAYCAGDMYIDRLGVTWDVETWGTPKKPNSGAAEVEDSWVDSAKARVHL